jgi:hypothetical protein
MENYLMLNGKRIDLTAEQIETRVGKKEKDPFERVERGEMYYYIEYDGKINGDRDTGTDDDYKCFDVANYCTDKELMEQRALHVILNQQLWRYAMQHGGREISHENDAWHYIVVQSVYSTEWSVMALIADAGVIGAVFFKDKETAEAAIEEIVKPFMEKHPEFRW